TPSDPLAVESNKEAVEVLTPQSPGVVFWTQMKKSPLAIAGGLLLAFFYLLAMFAPFVAPYPQEEMDRRNFFHPPQGLHWIHADGHFSLRPYVREGQLVSTGSFEYPEDASRGLPVRVLTRGGPIKILGLIPTTIHLYGVDPPGRIFILGTDASGRDVMSRLLYGSQISLTVGIVGIIISF